MPVVPKESLPSKKSFSSKKEDVKKLLSDKMYVYMVFIILGIEISSLFLRENDNYVYYWYPLLTQIALFVVMLTTFLKGKTMRFCQRRKIAFLLLTTYFAFGAMAIMFQIQNQFYIDIATITLLGGAFISVILTLFQNKK